MIRTVTPQDRSEWLRLRLALWPDTSVKEHNQEMQGILANLEQTPVFVAEKPSGGLCGLLEVSLKSKAEGCETQPIGYLEGWYVDQDWRKKGVGGELVAAAEAWAWEQGCREMGSDTTSDYPLSQAAHQRLGYKVIKQYIHFKKILPPPITSGPHAR